MKKTIHILLLLLVTFHAAYGQQESNTDTTDTESIRQKARGMMRELFMFEMAADVLETRQLISDNQLGDSVEFFMNQYNNALFFKSTLDYDFFWNRLLGRKKNKVPSSKLFLDSKEKYLRNNEPAGSIDFDIVLTPQWEDPQTQNNLKDYKVEITAGNYTNLSFSSEQKKHFNSTLNEDFDETCTTPRAAEVNEAIFKGLVALRRLLGEAQKPVEIGLDIHFEKYPEQSYGFDKLTYDVHKPSYQRRTYNGKKVLLP